MKLLMQHVQEEPLRPSSRTELPIPPSVDDLVMSCLAKDPALRPRDAEDLLRRSAGCSVAAWGRADAKQWWEAHLPQLVKPGTFALPRAQHAPVVNENASAARV